MNPIITTYSPTQAAELLGIPKSTVLAAITAGDLPVIRWNRRVFRITATDAALWYASCGGRLKSTTCATPTTGPDEGLRDVGI